MSLQKTYIYALVESGNLDYRYVGKSITPEKRTKRHVCFSKLRKTHKDNWIQSVLNRGGDIEFVILEETSEIEWPKKEKFWISKLKKEGYNLTNHNNGGLGGGHIIYNKPFDFVKNWVQKKTDIKSAKEWRFYVKNNKKPKYIPSSPKEVYLKKGWTSWGDFLGTDNKHDNDVDYISYKESKKYINDNLNTIKTAVQWRELAKKGLIPEYIPNRPERYYKNRGWSGWGDFLNTDRIANQNKKFSNYKDSKKWMSSNRPEINTVNKWYGFCKSNEFPNFIPKCPQLTYKNKGWINWFDFLNSH